MREIFSVEALPEVRFPDLLDHATKIVGKSNVLSGEAPAEVPEELRK